MKTLHPGVHGGILAKRDDPAHMDAINKHQLTLIDVVRPSCGRFLHHVSQWLRTREANSAALQVVANLYPFRQTVTAEPAPSYETAVENIDIGALPLQE